MAENLLEDYETAVADLARAEADVERKRTRCEKLRQRVAAVMERARMNPELPLNGNNPDREPEPVSDRKPLKVGATASMLEVARYLRDRGREADVQTIAAGVGTTYDGARIRCARAAKIGVIRRTRHGVYAALTEEGTIK